MFVSAVSLGGWKRGSDTLELAVQGAVSHRMKKVLGIESGFFARAVHVKEHLIRLLA